MKKIVLFFAVLFSIAAHAGPMANVEYVHKVIEQQWDIEVPYNPVLENPRVAANMKYLLTAIDVANKMLNGQATTDYGNSEYATLSAADTVATQDAAERLINVVAPFIITTTPDTQSFNFDISATGEFKIIWGDGTVDNIVRTDTTPTTYSHAYRVAKVHIIGIAGNATGYSSASEIGAISFAGNTNIAKISGSLGAVFGSINGGADSVLQPRFYKTFAGCLHMAGAIPDDLFKGVTGAPVSYMFYGTFNGCRLIGKIPANLFAGIQGAPTESLFQQTFSNDTTIGTIPAGLFAGIQGAPAKNMFLNTFTSCWGIKEIPAGLFAGIQGPPAEGMFNGTFYNGWNIKEIPDRLFAGISGPVAPSMFNQTFFACKKITSIPENLFGDIYGDAQESMFTGLFHGCGLLTGQSARINGTPLYQIWPDANFHQVGRCYINDTQLSDYTDIPDVWKLPWEEDML